MKKIIYLFVFLIGAGCLFLRCTKDTDTGSAATDENRIRLSDLSTRAVGNNGTQLYLMATSENPEGTYITEREINCPNGLSDLPEELIFPGGSPYYPLAENEIRFFAYSRKLVNGKMDLHAGLGENYDAVLSNTGFRESDTTPDYDLLNPVYEGKGTPGSSDDPAAVLQFRHVMTQLELVIKIDSTENPYVDPPPATVKIRIPGVVRKGYYDIDFLAPDADDPIGADLAIDNGNDLYDIQPGFNYLVPNGTDLDGLRLSYVEIDDYVANVTDLDKYVIGLENSINSKLISGYAYRLVVTLKRLQVAGVTLIQVPWQREELTSLPPDYYAYPLTVDLGSNYANANEDEIQKMVLYTSDRMYVGKKDSDSTGIRFVTLPASGIDRVDLYTENGLLLSADITTEFDYSTHTLTLPLSTGGMLPADAALGYDKDTNPYLITTPVQFLNIRKENDAGYRMGADLDLDQLNHISRFEFLGLGNFSGIIDGDGYYLSNVNITGSGLFAVNTGTIKNMRIFSGTLDATGENSAGSFCGVNNGVIVACINESFIENAPGAVGGIAGTNGVNGTIVACLNTGRMQSGEQVGGICGINDNTAEGAIRANINTGNIIGGAQSIGGACGASVDSGITVFRRCFWLVGTAQLGIGGPETVVGSGDADFFDCSDMDPAKLRNDLNTGEGEEERIMNRLDDEMKLTVWYDDYEFVLDYEATGLTWPAPMKK